MKEVIYDTTSKGHAFRTIFGIAMLAFLMLESTAGASPFAYITNSGDNTTSVIDIVTNNVTATIPVGINPGGVAVSPDGTRAYVTNKFSDNISVINTTTSTVVNTIHVGNGAVGIAVNPAGTKVYVVNCWNDNISVIDTDTSNWNDSISVIGTDTSTVIANNTTGISPDRPINIIKDSNRTVIAYVSIANVSVGINPGGVAVSPDGTKAYVANNDTNNISVIDTATNAVTSTVSVGIGPWGIAVSPDGKKVYVTNSGDISDISSSGKTVSVIDIATNNVTTLDVGIAPVGVAVDPNGTNVYVANYWGNTTSVINMTTNDITATIPVGSLPWGVAVTPDGTKVYVVNSGSDDVSVINTTTNNVTATVQVGSHPLSLGRFIG